MSLRLSTEGSPTVTSTRPSLAIIQHEAAVNDAQQIWPPLPAAIFLGSDWVTSHSSAVVIGRRQVREYLTHVHGYSNLTGSSCCVRGSTVDVPPPLQLYGNPSVLFQLSHYRQLHPR